MGPGAGRTLGDVVTLGDGMGTEADAGVWVILLLLERAASWACRRPVSTRQSKAEEKLLLSVMCSSF